MDFEEFLLVYYTLHFLDQVAFDTMDADCRATERPVYVYFGDNIMVTSFDKMEMFKGVPFLGEIKLTQSVRNTHRDLPPETVKFYLTQLKAIGMIK